ncbi:MAG: 1-acyl-sn-glycerol-3-phosphate acyltransferase [Oscillospiraceae bacterium]|nr:1-acyl-sn-glycerol-3-phosphate acyltransferase [Oscillospiraceae bacterium]
MLFGFAKYATLIYCRIAFRMRYEGLENIPRGSGRGYLLCANHRSYHDPVFLCHKIPQRLGFMAKAEIFRGRFISAVLKDLGAFPVNRGKGDTAALDKAADIIRNGGVLIVFPEGTRSKDGRPLRPRSGAAVLSKRTGADLLCCSIHFDKPKLRFRSTVTLRFHPLLTYENLGLESDSPSAIRDATKRIMETITSGLYS